MNTFKDYFNSVNASQIYENDAKLGIDKLAELSDFLSKGNVKIFIVTSSRHVVETEEHNVTGKYIYDTFYADPEAYPDFLRFNDPMPSFNELMVKIFQGKVAVIDHEENTAYFGLNMDQIKQYAMEDHEGYREYIKDTEKYNQIHENDAGAGIERLSKDFKLIGFFRDITLTPATVNDTDIDSILDTWYELAEEEAADYKDDDYQPHPEEIYDYMLNTIDDAFDAPADDYTAGIDINDVKARIEKWYDKRDPYIN